MKATRLNCLLRNCSLGISAMIILLSFNSCATNVSFLTSSVVPAARGTVKVKLDNNKNYAIDISLTDLAEVTRLQPPKLAYVVWMVSDEELTKNIGQVKSSKGILSKQLKGSFKTVSSFKPIKFFITAETDPGTQYPDTRVILSTNIFQL
jgi:hypothetical protein